MVHSGIFAPPPSWIVPDAKVVCLLQPPEWAKMGVSGDFWLPQFLNPCTIRAVAIHPIWHFAGISLVEDSVPGHFLSVYNVNTGNINWAPLIPIKDEVSVEQRATPPTPKTTTRIKEQV